MGNLGIVGILFGLLCALLAYMMAGKKSEAKKESNEAVERETNTVKEVLDAQKEAGEIAEKREEGAPVAASDSRDAKLDRLRK